MSVLREIEIREDENGEFPIPDDVVQVLSAIVTIRDAKDFNGSGYTRPVRFAKVVVVIDRSKSLPVTIPHATRIVE